MALPKIDLPTYELTIPSSGEVITVRPFSVKEEKLLLMALEGGKADDIIKTTKQIVNNCIIDGKVDIDKLPFFDMDYIFIFLRGKSIGETVEVNLTCNNILENGDKCGNVFPTKMDIAKCEINYPEDITDQIDLGNNKGIKLKYPNYSTMKHIDEGSEVDQKSNIIVSCIDYIYDEDGMYSSKDHTKDELKEFIEGLTEENYKKLEAFVDEMPSFTVNLEETCPKCGFHHKVRYSDFFDFFF